MEMKLEVKKVKTMEGTDGQMVNCELWANGKLAGTCIDDGNGGGIFCRFVNKEIESEVDAYIATLPPHTNEFIPGKSFPADIETVLCDLLDKYHEMKTLRRWCLKKTVFTLKGGKKGEYRTLGKMFCLAVANEIRAKYGDQLEEVINERF